MQIKDERRREMYEYLSSQIEVLFYNRTLETMQLYTASKGEILQDFLAVIEQGAELVRKFIDADEKQPVMYLHFSYLFSEVLRKKLVLKIDYYDVRYFKDINTVDSFWEYDKLFPYVSEDMEMLHGRLQKQFIRFKEYEFYDIRMHYHFGVFLIMKEILRNMTAEKAFSEAISAISGSEVTVLYGAYLDQADVIGIIQDGVFRIPSELQLTEAD